MKKHIILILLAISIKGYTQEVSCSDLLEFIESEGWQSSSVSNYIMQSDWLYKVTKYTYDYDNYIVAEIRENEYSYSTTKYIFCGVPNYNWTNFKIGGYGESDSYGERFHQYIFDYKCNCY